MASRFPLTVPLLVALTLAFSATAQPVDLTDPTDRDVVITVDLDGTVVERLPATLTFPSGPGGNALVTIAAATWENTLASLGTAITRGVPYVLQPGTVQPFVIVFGPATNEVVSAGFSLTIELTCAGFGIAPIIYTASSTMLAGFFTQSVCGELVPGFCTDPECTIVAGKPYDPNDGSFRTVGFIDIQKGVLRLTILVTSEGILEEAVADTDGDGIPDDGAAAPCATGETTDCFDNCPFEPNNGGEDVQNDSDANGRGDACECGNADGNTALDIFDALHIAQGTLLPPIVALLHLRACDADGNGSCDIFDALRVAQATLSPPLAAVVQDCDAATVPPPEP